MVQQHPVTGCNSEINSKTFVSEILGQHVMCTLSDGRTATGRLICLDRLKNLILSDCMCEQQICSTDYSPQTDGINKQQPVFQISTRYIQQAMIRGKHLVSVHLCDHVAYEAAIHAATMNSDDL